MNISIAHGILHDENANTVEQLKGRITAINTTENADNGAKHIVLTVSDGQETNTLRIKRYGDVSLKVIRCLAGIAHRIGECVICIKTEANPGHGAKIILEADGQPLYPLGSVSDYAMERNVTIDSIIIRLKEALGFRMSVLSIRASQPVLDVQGALGVIRTAAASGSLGEISVKHQAFNSPEAANGYLAGLNDADRDAHLRIFTDADADLIWLEWKHASEEAAAAQAARAGETAEAAAETDENEEA